MLTTITIPEEVGFSDLSLSREPDGSVSFDMAVVEKSVSERHPLSRFCVMDQRIASLACWWPGYHAHLAQGEIGTGCR